MADGTLRSAVEPWARQSCPSGRQRSSRRTAQVWAPTHVDTTFPSDSLGRKRMTGIGEKLRAATGIAAITAVLAGCSDPSGAQASDQPSQSEQAKFRVVPVATGLEHPWG